MRRAFSLLGAVGLLAGVVGATAVGAEGTKANSVMAQGNRAASPSPMVSPGTTERDRESKAPEVGIGRSTGAVKASGDEGGTAAGMPGKAPGGH
jgi:hypothetical protein